VDSGLDAAEAVSAPPSRKPRSSGSPVLGGNVQAGRDADALQRLIHDELLAGMI